MAQRRRGAKGQDRLLEIFQRLMSGDGGDLREALTTAADLVGEAFAADKTDIFLYEAETHTLVAEGTSRTEMGARQHALGLHRVPMANGGSVARCFETGEPYHTGRADKDPGVPPGVWGALGVRSIVAVRVPVSGNPRGVLMLSSAQSSYFPKRDVAELETVAQWVGLVVQRAELVAQVSAQAAEQARRLAADELVSVLAHDLRNLITPVRGRLQMLHRRSMREQRGTDTEDAAHALQGLQRLERMVANLLDVTRLDRGTFGVTPQPVDVLALAREEASAFTTTTVPVRVEAELDAELIALVDSAALSQALENLIANAVNVSPDGGSVCVRVSTEGGDDAKGMLAVIAVRDEGPGITPEALPRIFDRYARGEGSQGLGLGLYIARRIAEAHGGELTVSSQPGQGAEFRLVLPLTDGLGAAKPSSLASATPPAPPLSAR